MTEFGIMELPIEFTVDLDAFVSNFYSFLLKLDIKHRKQFSDKLGIGCFTSKVILFENQKKQQKRSITLFSLETLTQGCPFCHVCITS